MARRLSVITLRRPRRGFTSPSNMELILSINITAFDTGRVYLLGSDLEPRGTTLMLGWLAEKGFLPFGSWVSFSGLWRKKIRITTQLRIRSRCTLLTVVGTVGSLSTGVSFFFGDGRLTFYVISL